MERNLKAITTGTCQRENVTPISSGRDGEEILEFNVPPGSSLEIEMSGRGFTLISRDDGSYVAKTLANRILEVNPELHHGKILESVIRCYTEFKQELYRILQNGLSGTYQDSEIHIYSNPNLENEVLSKGEGVIISLDPLRELGNLTSLDTSRLYTIDGKKSLGQIARPGAEDLKAQIERIARQLKSDGHKSVMLTDDDIATGGTMSSIIDALAGEGITVSKIIPQIQTGNPNTNIKIDPVVQYHFRDGAVKDVFDPRDCLIGASGLVVRLPSGRFGRAPYIQPFMSSAERISTPIAFDWDLAESVFELNRDFYEKLSGDIGSEIILQHVDPNFQQLISETLGIDEKTNILEVINRIWDDREGLSTTLTHLGELQSIFEPLELPQKLIFLDVNGTILPEDAKDSSINNERLVLFRQKLSELNELGFSTGLCSDSPLPALREFGHQIGISGPIIAENGNLIEHRQNMREPKRLTIRNLENIRELKIFISEAASRAGFAKAGDISAIEFGGQEPDYKNFEWAFGADRETSISVFAPKELITILDEGLKDKIGPTLSIDASPENNFLAIHPIGDIRDGKGATLSLLQRTGRSIFMIGNSPSDFVPRGAGVRSMFVNDRALPDWILRQAEYCSGKPCLSGVLDILDKIIDSHKGELPSMQLGSGT